MGLTITGNVFDTIAYAINTNKTIRSAATGATTYLISDNYFDYPNKAIAFDNDDDTLLDITCNSFNNYIDYAIYSYKSKLKNQGDTIQGAGNIFTPANDTLDDRAFKHDGDTIFYYCSPSQILSFNLSNTHVIADTATDEASCVYLRPTFTIPTTSTASNNFVLYPNPTNSSVTLNYALGENASGHWTISNMMGQVIEMNTIAPQNNSLTIDVSKLTPGVYFSTIEADGVRMRTDKLVINR
jgi:hypothetical protein